MSSEHFKKSKKPKAPRVEPADLARDLDASIGQDHETHRLDPEDLGDLQIMARWGRPFGLFEADALATWHGPATYPRPRVPDAEIAGWISQNISPHPERFAQVAEACRLVQRRFLKAQVKRLDSCGTVWWSQHVLRVFWKDSKGRERLRRQVGIHRCKQSWCPTCGRSRQAQLTAEVEKVMALAGDFGLGEANARLVTLTVPNGKDINDLKAQAHTAFAKLQRTRWWNRNAFGWIRGSEVVTGEDGNWNLHIHLLAIFWSHRVSYSKLSSVWTAELGGARENGKNFVVDTETLESKRWERLDGKGHLKRKGGLMRAARYITKYLCKAEDRDKLKGGPGGLAHLVGATNGMRKFAVGGGCSVLRRTAKVLLPARAFQAEEAMAGTYLNQGRAPWRVEEMDPETGEVWDVPAERLADGRKQALEAWGEVLETNPVPERRQALPGRVVGIPDGPKGRYRRLGETPLAGRAPTVQDFERITPPEKKLGDWFLYCAALGTTLHSIFTTEQVAKRRRMDREAAWLVFVKAWKARRIELWPKLEGARAMIAGGDWKVYRWTEKSEKTGKVLKFAAVLPRVRYAWRPVRQGMLDRLAHGNDSWAGLRRKADRVGSVVALDPMARTNHRRALLKAFPDLMDELKQGFFDACRQRFEAAQDQAWMLYQQGDDSWRWDRAAKTLKDPHALWASLDMDHQPERALEGL